MLEKIFFVLFNIKIFFMALFLRGGYEKKYEFSLLGDIFFIEINILTFLLVSLAIFGLFSKINICKKLILASILNTMGLIGLWITSIPFSLC
jgi:hypothetical protein